MAQGLCKLLIMLNQCVEWHAERDIQRLPQGCVRAILVPAFVPSYPASPARICPAPIGLHCICLHRDCILEDGVKDVDLNSIYCRMFTHTSRKCFEVRCSK